MKWRATIALLMIIVVIVFNITWMWAIIFMFWVIPDLMTGVTYLLEPVERDKHPILYWSIILVWILTSIYLVIQRFFPSALPEGWG